MNTLFLASSKINTLYHSWFRERVEVAAVLSDIKEDGMLSCRFALFSIIGCAIATLGLLLNSPAVIIGAMLISPLMGPIVMQGFSLSMIDISLFRKSTLTLFMGATLSIFISFCIVLLSPITEINAEILARTSPNLFDLLIAIFSGLAAGYTFIKRKGSAIVGVAIATSLMPPLAVTGYGLATWTLWISEGAFFLFMTNLLAISLSVAILSKLYGFGHQKDSRYLVKQTLVAFSIFVILAIPLGISLKNIAFQAYVASKSKTIIKNYFKGKLNRLNDFNLSITTQNIDIDAVMITKKYDPKAKETLRTQLEEAFKIPVAFTLVQIALTNTEERQAFEESGKAKNNLVNPGATLPDKPEVVESLRGKLSKSLWFPYNSVKFDQERKIIHVYADNDPSISLKSLRNSEDTLEKQFPDWTLLVYPSPQHLPSLYFNRDQVVLTKENLALLDDIMWALKQWKTNEIDVIGYASTPGMKGINDRIAYQRAENVANLLKKQGFIVHAKGRFQTEDQRKKEKYKGCEGYQRVDIRLHYNTSLTHNAE